MHAEPHQKLPHARLLNNHLFYVYAELAVFKRDAHFIVAAVVEIQHVVVRVDAVPEEIDPVHQEHHQIRKLETTVRDNVRN